MQPANHFLPSGNVLYFIKENVEGPGLGFLRGLHQVGVQVGRRISDGRVEGIEATGEDIARGNAVVEQ